MYKLNKSVHKCVCLFMLNTYWYSPFGQPKTGYKKKKINSSTYWFSSSHIYLYIYLLRQIISEFWHYFPKRCQLGQTKDYEICNCCFSTYETQLMSKSKVWWAQNHDNMSEWRYMFTCRQMFLWASTIKIQLCVLF